MSPGMSQHDQTAWKARRAVAVAVRTGAIERQPCVECGAPAEAHHHLGYAPENWLDVTWLCRPHHMRRHFMGHQSWAAVKAAKGDPLSLRELRLFRGITQVQAAGKMAGGRSQTLVSRIESQRDMTLSTLRAYVKALGGELEITASFGDEQHRLG